MILFRLGLASASQTMLRVKFSAHFVVNCPYFGKFKLKKSIDFHLEKKLSFNFYFVKYEPYEKMVNVNLI